MLVYELGTSEEAMLKEAMELQEESLRMFLKDDLEKEEREDAEYELAHVITTVTIMKRKGLQELCERCLSYFWDMYKDLGGFCDELEELKDDMGLTEEEMVQLFHAAGFED